MSLVAYLDAGTGSQIAAMVAAGFAGLAVTAKFYWHRILVFLRIRKPDAESSAEQPDTT
ncbi:MAG: hypothetical protein M3131_09745 [Actinomycetota bacterium]|nr:hypothetical protein [Actinomycetota bacterium]